MLTKETNYDLATTIVKVAKQKQRKKLLLPTPFVTFK